jgi:glycine/D-amino acid oxidase-like deaminating enzyme/nitrite reductase/ring-hydroxylating ferredoxin subunit
MMKPRSATAWENAKVPRYPKLARSQAFDVAIIGAGITGVTTAYLLKRAGLRVCLLERGRLGSVDTGLTTAHLTYVTDMRLPKLVRSFGESGAKVAWDAGAAALEMIDNIVQETECECEFRRVPAFLHAAWKGTKDESRSLAGEAELAQKLGFAAHFVPKAPYIDKPAIRFANQAKFHPLKYLACLARHIDGDGSAVFEQSEVKEVRAEPLAVVANGYDVQCGYLVIATHVPLMGVSGIVGATLFQTKLALYSTYALGAKIPRGSLPEASFWDTSDPYYYLRIDRGPKTDYAIFGGEDHKTGQERDTEAPPARLQDLLTEILPEAKVERRWSGQVVETHDGLPYIGETDNRQFISTGFAGNGMTFGTLAGMMACDAVLKQDNPWSKLFAPNRRKVRGGAWDFVKENLDYPYYLLKGRLQGAEAATTRSIGRGQGKVIKIEGQRVACSRDTKGRLSKVSAICTHMGCIVGWNHAEQTWDCPCHGSRFRPSGEVMAGPAESPLEPVVAERKPAVAKRRKPARASK